MADKQDFSLVQTVQTVLGPTQSPVKCIPRVKPWGMKLIVQFRTAVKNVQSCSVMT